MTVAASTPDATVAKLYRGDVPDPDMTSALRIEAA
jgi:hypothetical protein